MLFLNIAILLGLAAVSIPVLIHLFNRKSADRVDWGAMQFLRDSLVSRRRRILLEEMLLLAVRCLLIALAVLAMARPFITGNSSVPWVVVLPMILMAIVLFSISFACWRYPRVRRRLLWSSVGLLLVIGLVILMERHLNLRRFGGKGSKDVALVLDCSLSMSVSVDGKPNFDRAREEIDKVISSAGRHSAFTLILGGAAPTTLFASPTTDRSSLMAALDDCTTERGMMNAVDALAAAAVALAQGDNPSKQILLFTDAQSAGWELDRTDRWAFVSQMLEHFPVPPQIVVRRFPLPVQFRNAALAQVRLSRNVVGTDREVGIDVVVENTGSEAITPSAVTLRVDGESLRDASLGQVLPGASETVSFLHHFTKSGSHVISATVAVEDDLPEDNAVDRVLPVIDSLRVLIVDGNPAPRFLDRAASFIALALAPARGTGMDDSLLASGQKPGTAGVDWRRGFLVQPEIVPAARLQDLAALQGYDVVILADVPRLPTVAADRLSAYASVGGGILVAPGSHAEAGFYNHWKTTDGVPVMPAALQTRVIIDGDDGKRVTPSLTTFSHPALLPVNAPGESGLGVVTFQAFWQLAPTDMDSAVSVGARLSSGDPLLTERKLGKGLVTLLACSLDAQGGNVIAFPAFVPFLHELVYHLAFPGMGRLNIAAAAEIALSIPVPPSSTNAPADHGAETIQTQAVDPVGKVRQAGLRLRKERVEARVAGHVIPGLYRISVPSKVCPGLNWLLGATNTIPFTILSRVEESRMTALSAEDYAFLKPHVSLSEAQALEDVEKALGGKAFGEEIWRQLAVAALVMVFLEIMLTRWIAYRRQTGRETDVEFESRQAPSASFREQLRAMRDVSKG
jgi:hypothetical protein